MFTNFENAKEYVEKNNIRMIDLKYSDLWGRWHHVTLPATEFSTDLMKSGVGFDGSSVGLKSVKSGDMALIPDLSTGFIDPFSSVLTISFLCNTVEADTKNIFIRDPRQIAKRTEQFLQKTGIATSSIWGPEFEFYVFDKAYFENTVNSTIARFESPEAHWNTPTVGEGNYIPYHGGYHAIPPKDKLSVLRTEIVTYLESANVPVKYHHHEVGGPGQCEIETPLQGMIRSADTCMLVKYMAKMAAAKHNQTVTFLPKPLFGEAGNGMHFHQLLMVNDKNLFFDQNDKYLLSKEAYYYIGGLLKHAPAIMAFTNPTTNSYKRLVPGYEAPVNCFFSSGNRSAAIRIPKYATQPEKVRFEFRPPDATCNPYLAMSAMLLAGIDGIQNRIDPSAEGFGPIDENIFLWTKEKRETIKSLPTSLENAVKSLKEDHFFLTKDGIFEEEMIEEWVTVKLSEEFELRSHPHPFELEKYFDF